MVQRPLKIQVGNHAAVLVFGLLVGAILMAAWQGVGHKFLPAGAVSSVESSLAGSSSIGALLRGTQVHATATHGESNFAIATGLVHEQLEAFYFLDFLTGDLRGAVVSRRTGKFVAFFERNIQQDFSSQSKNPKYLMVTGLADIPRGRANTQIGRSLIYVAEASGGEVNAYAVPWNPSLNAKGQTQRNTFIRLGGGSFRTTFVRDDE